MKTRLSFVLGSILALSALNAYADNYQVGIVDMNAVMSKSGLMASLNNKLNDKFKSRQAQIADAQKALQAEADRLNLDTKMTPDERNALQNKVVADKADLDIMNLTFQKDLTLAKDQSMQTFITKLNQVIASIAEKGHYDLIQRQNDMLFISNKMNITDQVLEGLK